MDQITFQHDTVLSDIHMLLPNAHHLMTRLNGVGQPVFISKFKIMSDGERHDRNDPGKGLKEVEEYDKKKEDGGKDTKVAQGKDGEEGGKGNVEPFLDEDGDLDIMHRHDCVHVKEAEVLITSDIIRTMNESPGAVIFGQMDKLCMSFLEHELSLWNCYAAILARTPEIQNLNGTISCPRTNPKEDSGRDVVCPVILQQSKPVLEQEEGDTDDEDDKPLNNIIKIEHTMATPLEDVGKQVWRGAFFLADFIVSKPHIFRGATVLELGAGTGLTSIIMATIAKTVYCTDVGEDLLSMCKKNVTLNRHMMEPAGGNVRVKQLDWLQCDLCTDADMEFSWTEEEVADIYNNTKIIIAADVCYDDDLTDGLFRTLYRLCCSFSHICTIFISIEKRMNFTLRHMDVSCDAYNHFRHCLFQLQDLVDGRCSFRVEQLPSNFAQFLLYERIEQLELWKVTATPLPM